MPRGPGKNSKTKNQAVKIRERAKRLQKLREVEEIGLLPKRCNCALCLGIKSGDHICLQHYDSGADTADKTRIEKFLKQKKDSRYFF
jgi:hypothetical protein